MLLESQLQKIFCLKFGFTTIFCSTQLERFFFFEKSAK